MLLAPPRLIRVLTAVLPLVLAALGPWASPAGASTTQYGCSFSVPKPSIKSGDAYFTVKASCASTSHSRKIDAELIGDDSSYDDTLQWTSKTATKAAGYAVKASGWSCQEDSSGNDEVYVQVRLESYENGSWRKAAWVRGSTASGNCY